MAVHCVTDLLHLLVDHCRKRNGPSHMSETNAEREDVLLDIEMDGARYLLVRLPPAGGRAQLSPREQEIVRMVAEGHPNKIIADVLSISPWTVCTYLRRIFAKLGVTSRAAMVARTTEIAWAREKAPAEVRSPRVKTLARATGRETSVAPQLIPHGKRDGVPREHAASKM